MSRKLKWLSLVLPLCLTAAEPVFHIPLDGSANVLDAKGETLASGIVAGTGAYRDGVAGKALDVNWKSADQMTTADFRKLPAMNCNSGTVSFWFKPEWREGQSNWIISSRDEAWKEFRFYLLRNGKGDLDLSVCIPGQVQVYGKNPLKAGEWAHIAFAWDTKASEVHFYINGKEIGKRTVPGAHKVLANPVKILLFLGAEGKPVQSKTGCGLYDDIKIFNRALSPEEVSGLAVRNVK